VTISEGTSRLVSQDKESIINAYNECKTNMNSRTTVPDLWDGGAAKRIAQILSVQD